MKEKERLVGYDRSAAKQTAIIDDQSDFFEIDYNIWLDADEKAFLKQKEEEVEEMRREEAKRVYITFDLLGRKIVAGEKDDHHPGVDVDVEEEEQSANAAAQKGQIPCNPNVEKEMKFFKSKP
jgi:hypothetical protein